MRGGGGTPAPPHPFILQNGVINVPCKHVALILMLAQGHKNKGMKCLSC